MAAPAMFPFLAVLLAAGDGPAPTPSLGAGAVAVSFQAPAFSEADALAAFEAGSQALVDARSAEAAARGDLAQAGLVPNPSLSLGASNILLRSNPPPTGNGPGLAHNLVTSAELDQPIELGGKRRKRLDQGRAALAGAVAGTADARRLARYEVRRAFWDAVRARERRALSEQVTQRAAEMVRLSRARYESQDISMADLEKVELEAMQQQNDLTDDVAAARATAAVLLGLLGPAAPPTVQVAGELAERPLPLDLSALVERARRERPDVAMARARSDAARAAVRLAEAQAVPDVTVGVGYTRSRATLSGDNPDALAVTLSLPLPLFSRNQGEIQKAAAEEARASRAAANAEAQVARDVEAALARYAAAAEKVGRYETGALKRADHALQVAERTWRAGDRSLLEYLEAERTWSALRRDYLDTLYELRASRFELERAIGGPLLPEPT